MKTYNRWLGAYLSVVESMMADIRQAARMLVRNAGFTATAVLILAITIGAGAAVFSVVNGVFLTPVPFPESDRLVHIWNGIEPSLSNVVNADSFDALRQANRSLEAVSAYHEAGGFLPRPLENEPTLARVSWNFFNEVLGIAPLLGRTFEMADEQAASPPVAMISYGFWVNAFGSDPDVLGRQVQFRNYPSLEIVGVLPPGFRRPLNLGEPFDVWTLAGSGPPIGQTLFRVVGRLNPDVTLEQARAELSVIQDAVIQAGAIPDALDFGGGSPLSMMLGRQLRMDPIQSLYGRPDTRTAILLAFGAVLAVVLIGLANIVALELARFPQSEGELALRAALGAPRWRLARLMLAKSLMVSAAGGILGTLAAAALHSVLMANLPSNVPRALDIRIDQQVLLFAIALSVASGLLIAIFPAVRASGSDVRGLVQSAERSFTGVRRHRIFRDMLTTLQTATALVLVVAAGLLIHSFWNVTSIDMGFDPDGMVAINASLPQSYSDAQYVAFMHDVRDRLDAIETVDIAAVSGSLPMFVSGGGLVTSVGPEGEVREKRGEINSVSGAYFEALRIPVVEGRTFTPDEAKNGALLAILGEGAARTLFPEGDPIGKRVEIGVRSVDVELTVVGIVGDVRFSIFAEKMSPVYTTSGLLVGDGSIASLTRGFFDDPAGSAIASYLVVRTSMDTEEVERVVANIQPDAVTRIEGMDSTLSANQASHRFRAVVLGAFASVAAFLAAIGVYSVLSHAVRQRTRELGIRMSFGAQRSELFMHVLRWALPPAAAGLLVGLGTSYALNELLAAYVYEIQPTDGPTYAIVTLFLSAVLLAAAAIPALRATRLDPTHALRHE